MFCRVLHTKNAYAEPYQAMRDPQRLRKEGRIGGRLIVGTLRECQLDEVFSARHKANPV